LPTIGKLTRINFIYFITFRLLNARKEFLKQSIRGKKYFKINTKDQEIMA